MALPTDKRLQQRRKEMILKVLGFLIHNPFTPLKCALLPNVIEPDNNAAQDKPHKHR